MYEVSKSSLKYSGISQTNHINMHEFHQLSSKFTYRCMKLTNNIKKTSKRIKKLTKPNNCHAAQPKCHDRRSKLLGCQS